MIGVLMTQRIRILLVEDNVNDAELTMAMLKSTGLPIDVDTAGDGEEALDYLYRRGPFSGRAPADPALLLMDLKMPKVSGAEVLQQVRADDRFKLVPIVMLTSSRETQDVRDCYRLGANGYVVKPVDAKQFSKAIKDLAAYWLSTNEPPPI